IEVAPAFANKYNYDVEISDLGLKTAINLKPMVIPRSTGLYSQQKFGRKKVNIVERLITHLMVPGHKGKKHFRTSKLMSGRYHTAFNIVYKSFERMEKEGKNPIQVLVKAIENSAPREEVMSMLIAGQRLAKQVDISPLRRVDLSLRWIAQGTAQLSASGKKADEALYSILTGAANNLENSFPVSKRIELERQAGASR
ncbi:MAG: 30S ribosomal protein S7, partial [Candidatus Parvarchaeota archaeon]|nr:30S ribosomal protein S7 [Candidatus Parvarchaeota archaeon]